MRKIVALAVIVLAFGVSRIVAGDEPLYCITYTCVDGSYTACIDTKPPNATCGELGEDGVIHCTEVARCYLVWPPISTPQPTPHVFISPIEPFVSPLVSEMPFPLTVADHTWTDTGELWMGEYQMLVNEQSEYCIPYLKECH